MEFRFNINKILPRKINKITHTLLPEGFRGDRREYNECQRILSRILDDMGEASSKAQRLNKTITSAIKLRDTDHIVYLMVDSGANKGLGSVVGLLKTGSKSLFMFDENGYHYQLKPRCILDFYVHESRQRKGLGLQLYQHMLAEENLKPIKLAIDRPSDKFMAFLMKHYGFSSVIPQNNNFVVFRGFFDDETRYSDTQVNNKFPYICSMDQQNKYRPTTGEHSSPTINNGLNGKPTSRSAYGRYSASRPACSMADIIHNTATNDQSREQSRVSSSVMNRELRERPDTLDYYKDDTQAFVNDFSKKSDFVTESNQFSEHDVEDEIVVDNFLNDDDVKLESLQSLDIQDKNVSHTIETENNMPDVSESISAKETEENRPGVGHLDLKFYHSPLW